MLVGFDVTLNGKNISAAIEEGILTLILTKRSIAGEESLTLHVEGLDLESKKRISWLDENSIIEGDEIQIKIKQVKETTPASNIKDYVPKK